jgi:hypothetical protein
MRRAYQSDLSDAEWSCLAGYLPAQGANGRPRLKVKSSPTRSWRPSPAVVTRPFVPSPVRHPKVPAPPATVIRTLGKPVGVLLGGGPDPYTPACLEGPLQHRLGSFVVDPGW